ncbi:ElyC/SanA/YdcF family protein, partial [Duncaniella freteri]|uniref:SanA/YdcF family protein n=1 Tax=Duncaniella freteri TaxID=2530391 RepID=UPI002572D275
MKRHKKIISLMAVGAVSVLLLIAICHCIIVWNASGKTYDNVEAIPHNKVGLLLATSPITPGGAHNFYFENRIKAADELYKAGKIDFIIASGGDYRQSQRNGCDEPGAIRDSLVARGIPENRIILDYEGTTTRNSIYKAKQIFELDSVTLISQKYHNERAIFLAELCNINAVGYNADPSPIRRNRIKNTLREYLARVKMFGSILFAGTPSYSAQTPSYDLISTTTSPVEIVDTCGLRIYYPN